MTGVGVLKAFDFGGKELWSRDIQTDYGRFGLNWGYASSPLLHGDALYVQVLHGMKTDDPSYLLQIDGQDRQDAVAESSGRRRAIGVARFLHDAGCWFRRKDDRDRHQRRRRGHGHDPATGKELWRVNGLNPQNAPTTASSPRRCWSATSSSRRAATTAAGDQARRARRRHRHASPVVRERTRRADAGQRRQVALRGQDRGVVFRLDVTDGHDRLRSGTAAERLLQCVPGPGRRQDLRHRRDAGLTSSFAPARSSSCSRRSAERLLPQFTGYLRGPDFHPHNRSPLGHWTAKKVGRKKEEGAEPTVNSLLQTSLASIRPWFVRSRTCSSGRVRRTWPRLNCTAASRS